MATISVDKIQLIALASVEDPGWKEQYRHICRWYSREFSTPLFVVENELDQLHVLTHYYEDSFGKLYHSESEASNARYEEIKERLLKLGMSDEEIEAIEAEDDDWAEQMIAEIKENHKEIEKAEAKRITDLKNLESPNLEDEIDFNVQGEDTPPEY